jgi:hypothetical protein
VITCEICGATVRNVDAAIDAGWYPSHWRYGMPGWRDPALGDVFSEEGPICPGCANDPEVVMDGEYGDALRVSDVKGKARAAR